MADSQSGARAPGASIPPCPPEVCSNPAVRAYVAEVCKNNNWPPDKHVIVEGPQGYCYCTCGGA